MTVVMMSVGALGSLQCICRRLNFVDWNHLLVLGSLMHGDSLRVPCCQKFRCSNWTCQATMGKHWTRPRWAWYMVMWVSCGLMRVGEAKVPGPPAERQDIEWTLGVCNPSGLPNKAHIFCQQVADLWCVSETHLSKHGQKTFQKHLAAERSCYKWCVAGWPVPPRSNVSFHGGWSGVAAISQHPTRSLPDNWSSEIAQSSRILCSATLIHDVWVSGVTVYGVPIGPTHPQARAATGELLDAAITRLQCMHGPRFLAGDLNHDLDKLSVLQRLSAMHFVEAQDLFQTRSGIVPKATCKGKTRRDFLFLSPELAALFVDVRINYDLWADHATLVARFRGGASAVRRYPWPIPKQIPWNQVHCEESSQTLSFESTESCTQTYQRFWNNVETRASNAIAKTANGLPSNCPGRGQRLERLTVVGSPAPPKKGRDGEFQPLYFGLSFLHAQRIRQVRRLQSYLRVCTVASPTANHVEHLVSLWQAIRNASGFAPDFTTWWSHRIFVVGDPESIPTYPPGAQVAAALLNAMQVEVRNLEYKLKQTHSKQQRKTRSSGLAQLYASVRRDAPVPVDVLIESKQATVDEVDQELSSVVLRHPVCFEAELPLTSNGQCLSPIMITDDQIFLESTAGIQPGDIICQTKSTGRLDDVFQAFTEQWSARWNKHGDIPHSHWDNLFQFAAAKIGKVEAPALSFTNELIRATASAKKAKAAVGLDGVSRSDLLHLNDSEISTLGSLFRRAHATGEWPRQLTQGQVKALAKREKPGGGCDYRPITIFPIIYRVWSSIASQHWLKFVSSALDSRLHGNRAGHRAAHLWRTVLEEVEAAHGFGINCAGVVFDLEKAFNTLPRLVCLGIAKLIGVDHGTLTAWSGVLGSMERRFVVLGSLSLPIHSTCGFAEGCGMSCLAMMMLDQVWHAWIREASVMCQPMSYVDNWEVVVTDPELIRVAANATFELAQQLDIVVDRKKTFAWATSGEFRKALRQQGFTVKLDAADLGAHVTYSQQLRNSSMLARFHNLQDFWIKLKAAFGTHSQKAQVVLRAAWPRAMHAVSATLIGTKHYHKLRSAYMVAQRLDRPGANSFLQLHCDGFLADPHAYALLQTFRDHRDLGSSSWHSHVLADLVHGGLHLPSGSVSQVLLKRLHFLQWAVLPDGRIQDQFGAFDLVRLNWSELCLRFQMSWHRVVTRETAHRHDFTGFQKVDVMTTRAALTKLTPYQQGICRRNMNGSTLTNEHAFHWSTSGSVSCPHCDLPDSLTHRYWECSHSLDLRTSIDPCVLDLVPALPRACTVRSWFLRSPLLEPWWEYLLSLPSSVPLPHVTLEGRKHVDFFTDGSCLHQDSRAYRVAAWAVCVAIPFEESVNAGIGESQVMGATVLPGLIQTSFRAELMALVAALVYGSALGCTITIWTDCLGVQLKYLALTRGGCQLRPNSPNMDLWSTVLDLAAQIGENNITVVKVAAHQILNDGASDIEKWVYHHNAAADHAAKTANRDRPGSVWTLWEQLVRQTEGLHRVCNEILDYQLKVCERWSESSPTTRPQPTPVVSRQHSVQPMAFDTTVTWDMPPLLSRKLLGSEHAGRILAWWTDFIEHGEAELCWVSFIQMYVHFQLTMKHPGAVKCGRKWKDPKDCAILLPEQHSFRVRSRWFRMQVQRLWKDCRWKISTTTTRPNSDRISCFVGCASIPAKRVHLQRVEKWLENVSRPIVSHVTLDILPLAW